MTQKDEDKTAFYTDKGTFCYKKMPFMLRNAGATYRMLVDRVFEWKIGQNGKVYVNDMVIKSKEDIEFLRDIEETMVRLRDTNMKLNLKNVSSGSIMEIS